MIPDELQQETIKIVYLKLFPHIKKTPLIKSWPLINDIFDTNLFFKMEFLQHAGTFKARGAINNVLNLDEEKKQKSSSLFYGLTGAGIRGFDGCPGWI